MIARYNVDFTGELIKIGSMLSIPSPFRLTDCQTWHVCERTQVTDLPACQLRK